jgi:hypothetical protein
MKRPLSTDERSAIMALLEHADFDGRDALLAQVDDAHVVGGCGCGCAPVTLAVGSRIPADDTVAHPIPNEATVLDASGESVGGVLLFVRDGLLRELEVYDYAGTPIFPFPPLQRLRVESAPA